MTLTGTVKPDRARIGESSSISPKDAPHPPTVLVRPCAEVLIGGTYGNNIPATAFCRPGYPPQVSGGGSGRFPPAGRVDPTPFWLRSFLCLGNNPFEPL